jgi:hypothetical protein
MCDTRRNLNIARNRISAALLLRDFTLFHNHIVIGCDFRVVCRGGQYFACVKLTLKSRKPDRLGRAYPIAHQPEYPFWGSRSDLTIGNPQVKYFSGSKMHILGACRNGNAWVRWIRFRVIIWGMRWSYSMMRALRSLIPGILSVNTWSEGRDQMVNHCRT